MKRNKKRKRKRPKAIAVSGLPTGYSSVKRILQAQRSTFLQKQFNLDRIIFSVFFHNKYFYTVGIFNCIILSIYFSFVFTVTYFYFVFTVTYFYTVVKISFSMLVASLIWYFNKIWGWFLNKVLNFNTICQWLYDLLTKIRYNLLEERMKELTCEQMVEYLRSWP